MAARTWVSYREEPEVLELLDEEADRQGISRSELLREAVRQFLEDMEKELSRILEE